MFKVFRSSILAGICIAMGGTAFLKVGGLEGAILFSFGLLTVVHYALKLYTGTAGFFKVDSPEDWATLPMIICGNFFGCLLMALLIAHVSPQLVETAQGIMAKRDTAGIISCFLNAICCGFIMTTAVQFGRKNHFLPLLFGVPLFIMCGFTHSIADCFYFLLGATPERPITSHILWIWFGEIGGNFLGCNLYRMLRLKTQ
ncbi:MAG: formate/nitrite transporter family protein [Bacteroidaceae bacterium]|nr:formate/nitrite transporter family protein [Bacteroidaceae bacterium]